MTTELQVFVLVRVTVNAPPIPASLVQSIGNVDLSLLIEDITERTQNE